MATGLPSGEHVHRRDLVRRVPGRRRHGRGGPDDRVVERDAHAGTPLAQPDDRSIGPQRLQPADFCVASPIVPLGVVVAA